MSSNADAEKCKELGNECFKSGHYSQAVVHYSAAIELDSTVPSYYLNRALMHLRLECPGAALCDADAALALDPNLPKAYYRKGYAHYLLGHHKDAMPCFSSVLMLCPEDKDAKQMFTVCDKEVTRDRFLKAIATPEDKRPYETMQWETIVVEPSHKGPILDNSQPITIEFVNAMMDEFAAGRLIHRKYATRIMLEARALFAAHQNVVQISVAADSHITVCGDVHGQFYDLKNIFQLNGFPSPSNPYVFNGDVVDRGSYSVECLLTMLGFKVLYPNHFFLSRGNHEGLNLNKVYGFEGEMKAKYSPELFDLCHDVFRALPLGHILGGKVFLVHGGLFSKDGVTIADINGVNRFRDIPEEGLMCEMLWSDPQPMPGRAPNKRGVGVAFGPDVTSEFLRTNSLSLVVRSHEVKDDGYCVEHGGQCITVFSAPNYCDQLGNKGAFIKFHGSDFEPKFTSFTHVPHAGRKPMQYSPYTI
jgi:serine/threonine-protein phosphatase 5